MTISILHQQSLLLGAGFDPGAIDGIWGPNTQSAYTRWKQAQARKQASPAYSYGMVPRWLSEAREHIGLSEYKGRRHNPRILRWWKKIRASFTDDETPWCAAFVGGVLEDNGIRSSRSAAARSYERWGVPLNHPVPGCIAVFWRGSRNGWSGHVGFVAGKDQSGNLMILGGNQGDKVSIRPFSRNRLLSYRWPKGFSMPDQTAERLALVRSDGKLSTNEA